MEEQNPVADDAGREREREKAQAPLPSNCSANYYAKISEILATHDQLFWPTLYIEPSIAQILTGSVQSCCACHQYPPKLLSRPGHVGVVSCHLCPIVCEQVNKWRITHLKRKQSSTLKSIKLGLEREMAYKGGVTA